MSDRLFLAIAKGLAFLILWIAAAVVLFRFGVGSLWGSRSDLGLLAAPFLAAFGVLGLAWLALAMVRDIRRGLAQPKEPLA